MNLDIGKAFTFVTDDPRWVTKLAIGGGIFFASSLLSIVLVGLVGYVILFGYLLIMTRNVIAGNPTPLPEWDNWGELLSGGLKNIAVQLVLALPAIIIYLFMVLTSSLSGSRNSGASLVGSSLSLVGCCLLIPAGLFAAITIPAAVGRLAGMGSIGSALNPSGLLSTIRANFGVYAVIVGMTIVTAIIANLGFIALCIGVYFTTFFAYLVNHHLYGQAYRNTQSAPIGYGQQPMYGEPRPF